MADTDNFLNVVGNPALADGVIVSGQVVGDTLILTNSLGGTVNIQGIGTGTIDFNNLSAAQKQALNECLRGETYQDAFGIDIGYLLTL